MTVIHLKSEFKPDMEDAGRPGSRTRQMMDGLAWSGEGQNPLVHDIPSAEIVAELAPLPFDVVVTKTRFGGFWGTNLHDALSERAIQTLIFTGGTTTVCVESTLRYAVFLEYNALALSDCTADMNLELHESALARIELFFGWVCRSDELITALAIARDETVTAPLM
jgi:ureidoacrylate peracid hydrolase